MISIQFKTEVVRDLNIFSYSLFLFSHYNDISLQLPLKSHLDKHVIDSFMIMFLFRKVCKILSLKFLFFSIFHQLQDVQSKIYTKLPKHLPQYSPRIFFSRQNLLQIIWICSLCNKCQIIYCTPSTFYSQTNYVIDAKVQQFKQ